jgi:anti-sigma regulatory factor (Ser/Thr protein kinase)
MSKRTQADDRTIHDLMAVMVGAVHYEEVAQKIVQLLSGMFQADLCTLWRLVEIDVTHQLTLSASTGSQIKPGFVPPRYDVPGGGTPNEKINGITPWIAVRRKVCLANSIYDLRDNQEKPWFGSHKGKWDKDFGVENFKNLLGLPIIYLKGKKDEKLLGVLKIESRKTGDFTVEDQKKAENLIPFIATALETMAERERFEQKRQVAIRELTGSLSRLDTPSFYQEVVAKTAELLRADICSLWLVDPDRKKLRLGANFGVRSGEAAPPYDLNWDAKRDEDIQGLTPWVVIRQQSFFGERHEDLRNHPAWKGVWDGVQWSGQAALNFGCLYAVPLIDVYGRGLGVLKIENKASGPKFDAVDRATFDLVAEFIPLAIAYNTKWAEIVFDFFHLLKQPVSNSLTAFGSLRMELDQPEPRQERITSRLEMLARNLETVRVWTLNVYGLATRKDVPGEVPEVISLKVLFQDAIATMRNLFPDFRVQLKGFRDIDLRLTSLQKKKVDAILYNLLDNSYKYSREPRRIQASVVRHAGGLKLTMRDNGIGISPEDLSRVFEPYFSRSAEKWPSSMGLGLTTVARLLEELGWDKEIQSKLNEGTRFTITIPKEYLP